MKKFHRNDREDRGGQRGRSFGDKPRPQMHSAVCSNCSKNCEVPFRPNGDKPVYCSDCYKEMGGGDRDRDSRGSGGRSFDRRDSRDRGSFGSKTMYIATCDRCSKKCEVPFRPTGDKPVYCSDCFEIINKPGTRAVDNSLDKHFASLNAKLDQVIKLLSPAIKTKVVEDKPAKEKVAVKKIAPTAKAPAKKKVPAKKKK